MRHRLVLRAAAFGAAIGWLAACDRTTTREGETDSAPGATVVNVPPAAAARADLPERFGDIGRRPTADEIRAWDIDANPAGVGLPAGSGTYQRGAQLFLQRCAACHGVKGEGLPPNPRLIGREPADFSFGRDVKAVHTIGNYWPYATTLFDYINRAMPFDAPGSLPPSDVYSLIAYLLAENGVVEKTTVIDARSLPAVRMPARTHFVPDDRTGGSTFR